MDCTVTVAAGDDLAAAVSPGAVVCLGAGVHRANLDLTHSVTLKGEPGAVLDGGGRGPVIRIGVHKAEVVLDNIELRGGAHEFGSGVLVEGYATVTLRGCTISGNQRGPGSGAGLGVHRGWVTVEGGRFGEKDDVVVTTAAEATFLGVGLPELTVREGAKVTVDGGTLGALVVTGTSTRQPVVTLKGVAPAQVDNSGQYPGAIHQQ